MFYGLQGYLLYINLTKAWNLNQRYLQNNK